MLLELLLRERRASSARSKLAADREKEERDFIAMDRILNPLVYEELDRIEAQMREASRKEDLNRSLEDDRVKDLLGGKYERPREEYIEGLDKEEVGEGARGWCCGTAGWRVCSCALSTNACMCLLAALCAGVLC